MNNKESPGILQQILLESSLLIYIQKLSFRTNALLVLNA